MTSPEYAIGTFTMDVGRLYWNTVRDYLTQQRFYGAEVTWIESSGWVERAFTIKGPAYIATYLRRWATQVDPRSNSQ